MNKSTLFFIFIVVSFMFPYFLDVWWKFIPSTCVIFLGSFLFCGFKYRSLLGTDIRKKSLIISLGIFLILYFLFKIIIHQIIQSAGIQIIQYSYLWFLGLIFQVLNEEIVLRSLLLRSLKKYLGNALFISVVASIVFTVLHFIFHKYNLNHKTNLNINCLLTLFLFGLICNYLYIKFGHIWYAFSIHISWNLNKFTQDYFLNQQKLSEGDVFNLIEGNYFVTILVFIFSMISLILLYKYRKWIPQERLTHYDKLSSKF